jgi:hypothetical protein
MKSYKKNYVWISHIWIFFQMTSHGEATKTKVAYLEKLYNFVVDNFYI